MTYLPQIKILVPSAQISDYTTGVSTFEGYTNTEYKNPLPSAQLPFDNLGTRCVWMGGEESTHVNKIEYVTVTTLGNASNFGTLTVSRSNAQTASSTTRGIYSGGTQGGTRQNVIDYITIATTGNATDFGDLSIASDSGGSVESSTRAVMTIGSTDGGLVNTIDYVTFATTGNASDFGDLSNSVAGQTGISNGTTGLLAGTSTTNVVDKITIATTGNTRDTGDLTVNRYYPASACSHVRGVFSSGDSGSSPSQTVDYINFNNLGNAVDYGEMSVARTTLSAGHASSLTRGLFGGGVTYSSGLRSDVIDYITIATNGNALDFGDLTNQRRNASGLSDCHGGLSSQSAFVQNFKLFTTKDFNLQGAVEQGIACFVGGWDNTTRENNIEYVDIATIGTGLIFGDLTQGVGYMYNAGSSSTRGLRGGGELAGGADTNTIDYWTFASSGNATDFGDITDSRYGLSGFSSSTRAIWGGGRSGAAVKNVIDYITIATLGNATDFGDLSVTRYYFNGTFSDGTTGGWIGGYTGSAASNVIDYVTISTTGNATDFGDMTDSRFVGAGSSNKVKAVTAGGGGTYDTVAQSFNITSTGNAVSFGNLSQTRGNFSAAGSLSRLVFACGEASNGDQLKTVESMEYATAGSTIRFGDLSGTAGRRAVGSCSSSHGGL